MKKANGTMLAFICLMGLVLCAGVTAANIDSQQLKSFYDRMQNQMDIVLSGDLSADQQILLAMLISYGQSPSAELQKELPSLYYQALKAGTAYLLMSDTDYTWVDTTWVGDQLGKLLAQFDRRPDLSSRALTRDPEIGKSGI